MTANKLLSSSKVIYGIIAGLSVAMVIYHLLYSQLVIQEVLGHLNTHLSFALLILFMLALSSALKAKKKAWSLWIILSLLALVSTGYIAFNYIDLDFTAGTAHSPLQLAIGVTLIVVSIAATWHEFGPVLPILAMLFILYGYFGYLAPPPFDSARISFDALVSKLSINMEGIYGLILNVSATKVFLFMVFAAWMMKTGATGFFMEVGKLIGRWFKTGAAVTAVLTSGMVGSITGQAAANVSITGSFTIPAMKKTGYTPAQAGGIEAAASSGGPIIPPVMGIAAFIMSGITGIRYFTIITIAVIPALLYVLSCLLYVFFQGAKMKVFPPTEKVNLSELLLRAPLFFVPLLFTIFLFLKGRTPLYVSFWACVTVFGLSLFRKETRPSLSDLITGFVDGARLGSQVAVTCATLGMIVKVITMSGLGLLLPHIIGGFSGQNLTLLLVLTGVTSIILGMGLPAATSYVLVAVVLAPILLELGVEVLPAHFFCFYFCNFSYISPPVALAAIFASKLAGAGYIRTAVEAAKVGIAGFILPFMFIWNPALMLNFSEPAGLIVMKSMAVLLTLLGLQAGIVGYFLTELDILKRAIAGVSAILLVLSIYSGNIALFAAGVASIAILILWQYVEKRRLKSPISSTE
jgi:TRAP transporter 4TM/12TM fusion protein